MSSLKHSLLGFKKEKEYLIGIDSDGCVFDTMEIKHKECFCPAFISHFNMQAVSKYAREAWEFINLYSQSRGENRFLALIHVLDLLKKRVEALNRKVNIPNMTKLHNWILRESKLGNPTLKQAVQDDPHPDLISALNWSLDVNCAIKKIVRNVPPFPFVRECFEKITGKADVIAVSSAPYDALKREWYEHDIAKYVKIIAGQEMGTKTEHITNLGLGNYQRENILIIGDAPGDFKAARANNAHFYPIIPGQEVLSWQRLYEEALDKFFAGLYEGNYESNLLKEFEAHLPEYPSWQDIISAPII